MVGHTSLPSVEIEHVVIGTARDCRHPDLADGYPGRDRTWRRLLPILGTAADGPRPNRRKLPGKRWIFAAADSYDTMVGGECVAALDARLVKNPLSRQRARFAILFGLAARI